MYTRWRPKATREKARTISCTNNLKQLGLGLIMYTGDNAQMFIGYDTNGGGGNYPTHWNGRIHATGYISDMQVYRCPNSTKIPWQSDPSNRNYLPGIRPTGCRIWSDYALNYGGGYYGALRWNAPAGVLDARITEPSDTLWVMDGRCNRSLPGDNTLDGNYYRGDTSDAPHIGSTNALYCDGHSSNLKWTQLRGYVQGSLGPWTYDTKNVYN